MFLYIKAKIWLKLFLIIILALNTYFWHSTSVGIIFGLLFLFLIANSFGNQFFKEKKIINLLFGILITLCLIAILGTAFYYPLNLKNYIILIILLLISVSSSINIHKYLQISDSNKYQPITDNLKNESIQTAPKSKLKLLLTTYCLLLAASFYILFTHNTVNAIKTPWQVVPSYFFVFYFLTALLLIIISIYDHKKYRPLFLTMLFTFLSSCVALFVYRLGYGFDPFIHQATEKIIYLKGLITPKPFYYIGQYSIVIVISKIFQVSVEWTDKLLVPLIASIFVPLSMFTVASKIFKDKISRILPIIFLSIPFSIFIVTTPQNLANTLLLILIAFSFLIIFNKQSTNIKTYSIFLSVLALAIFAIHPLTGIPAFIFLALLFTHVFLENKKILRINLLSIITILSSLALPIVFYLNSKLSLAKINISFSNLNQIFQSFQLFYFKSFDFLSDFVYLYNFKLNYIIIFLTIISIYLIVYRLRTKDYRLLIYPLTFVILLINYLILKICFDFAFVISYEQNDYANRILEISFYFLIPLALYPIYLMIIKALSSSSAVKIFILIFLAGLITSSLYLSYPRYDKYERSHFVNLAQSDINTVNFIEKNSENKKYIVLANQTVSSAALKEFGFDKYYNELYYYPIPTSSPLYQYYLKMVYEKPIRQTMNDAMDMAGVNESYLVINDYWTDFVKISEQAKVESSQWWELEGGKIMVFEYKK